MTQFIKCIHGAKDGGMRFPMTTLETSHDENKLKDWICLGKIGSKSNLFFFKYIYLNVAQFL